MSSLGQGETHSGWRSCWGEATPMLGRDGSSIVIAPFIRGAMMSCTRLHFLLPVAWAEHQLIPHRAAASAAGSDKNLAAAILLSTRLIDLYRFKHQSVSNQPMFQFVPTKFCFATSSNRDQTWSNLYLLTVSKWYLLNNSIQFSGNGRGFSAIVKWQSRFWNAPTLHLVWTCTRTQMGTFCCGVAFN